MHPSVCRTPTSSAARAVKASRRRRRPRGGRSSPRPSARHHPRTSCSPITTATTWTSCPGCPSAGPSGGARPPRRARRRPHRRDGPGETVRVGDLEVRDAAHARTHEGDALLARRGRRVHRRHPVQELGRRRARPGSHDLHRPQALDHGRLLALPGETIIRPGHTEPTTVAQEWDTNAFVRVWRGLDPEGDEPCTALGEPATLVLLGDDYDGGHKAWVRWPDGPTTSCPARRCSGRAERALASVEEREQ